MPLIIGENIVCRDPVALKLFFSKLKKEELIDLWSSWGLLEDPIPEFKSKKTLLHYSINNYFANGLTYNQVADFELEYYRQRPKTRKWKVWQLIFHNKESLNSMMDDLKDPSVFKAELAAQLGIYFSCHTSVQHADGHLWIRLGIYDNVRKGTLPSAADSTYIVYYPHSTYVFISALKHEQSEYILKALAGALRCEDVCDPGASLSSSNVESLADLMLYPTSQGAYRAFRLDRFSDNPLDLLTSQKRKKSEKEKEENEKKRRLPIQEDKEKYDEREKRVRSVFGVHDEPQPSLNNINVHFKTDFCGQKINIPEMAKQKATEAQIATDGNKPSNTNTTSNTSNNTNTSTSEDLGLIKIEMHITLDGNNVLEGLKQLSKMGVATRINDGILKDMWKSNNLTIIE